MRRLAPILSIAFLFAVQATAAGWRQCPHHDTVTSEHASPGAAQHAGHADVPAAPEHSDGPCSCLSGAQCTIPVALHATTNAQIVAVGPITLTAALPLAHQASARIPSLYLPEATAPPAAL